MSNINEVFPTVLSSARDDLKRAKREGDIGGGGGHHSSHSVGGGSGGGGATRGEGSGKIVDLHSTVRKLVKELTSQTCFEDADLERAHVAVLAGVCVRVCMCVCVCMRVHNFYSLLRYSPKHAVKTMTYSAHVAVLAGMCVFVRARLYACRPFTCGRTGTYVLV